MAEMTKVATLFGCHNPLYSDAREFIAGLECEIEAVKQAPPSVGIFKATQDGSLRNGGLEYVSAPALRPGLVDSFKKLHETLLFKDGEDPFSVRTSTHVHVNCQSLTAVQARNMVLLYALYEEFFFMMVKPTRRDNIHCVPLTETAMPRLYKHDILVYFGKWHKYTALNLKRLADLGTMEFRHLHGTNDVGELSVWLEVLNNLWTLAQKVEKISEANLNKETIAEWFETLFKPVPRILSMRPVLFETIRNSLIDVKFSV